jgi:hypothetical protein
MTERVTLAGATDGEEAGIIALAAEVQNSFRPSRVSIIAMQSVFGMWKPRAKFAVQKWLM